MRNPLGVSPSKGYQGTTRGAASVEDQTKAFLLFSSMVEKYTSNPEVLSLLNLSDRR